MRIKKIKDNFLDYVPRPNTLFPAASNAAGHIEIAVQNKGFFNKIAQVVFKRPKVSHIELDDFGSFVWRAMDGERSVYAIGQDGSRGFWRGGRTALRTAVPLY